MFDLTLTFDNGPEPDVTPRVLDILGERGIKTTFFVIGEKLADPARRGLAMRAPRRGPLDRQSHLYAYRAARAAARSPIRRRTRSAARRLRSATSRIRKRWFRPFGGGGNLDDRLLKPSVVDYLTAQQA